MLADADALTLATRQFEPALAYPGLQPFGQAADEVTQLGRVGGGFGHLIDELPRERLALAVTAVGHAQGAMEKTIEYVTTRKAFGQVIVATALVVSYFSGPTLNSCAPSARGPAGP